MSDLCTTNLSLHRALFELERDRVFIFIRCIEKKRKKKWYKAIPWQIVTRKVTENGLGAINTGRGSERGWCSGVELRTRASCVTDVQQVAFLGSYPLAPSLPSPSLQANPGHIKSFLNVLTLAVWLLFDRYRPHFDVHPFSHFHPSLLFPLCSTELGTMDPRSTRIDGFYAKYFFIYRISISFFIGDPLFFFLLFPSLLIWFVSYCDIFFFRCFFFVFFCTLSKIKIKSFFKWKVVKSIRITVEVKWENWNFIGKIFFWKYWNTK